MLNGVVLHDLAFPATNTSVDEIEALRHCRSVAFRSLACEDILADPEALRGLDVLLCSSSFNPSRKLYEPKLLEHIALHPGIKILTLQDEHGNVEAQREWIRLADASLVITMCREPLLHKLYPMSDFGHVQFLSALPGYVPERLEQLVLPAYGQRPTDIAYRGRYQGFGTGALGLDKHRIGELLREGLRDSGLRIDIDPLGERRVTGSGWDSLLQSSKACVAVESGSSLIDWDGSLTSKLHHFQRRHPRATFSDVTSRVIGDRDWDNIYTAASPRIFEYAANGCMLLLTEGLHSGVVEPWRHYVPIRRDCSNLDEIVSAVRDPNLWQRMTETAREELIESGRYSWRAYAGSIDAALSGLGLSMMPFTGLPQSLLATSPLAGASSRIRRSQRTAASIKQLLRDAVPVSLRTRLWGLRVDARKNVELLKAWIRVGIPWLVRFRSLTLAREVCIVWRVRKGCTQDRTFLPRFVISAANSEYVNGRFEGLLQILCGYEVWNLARSDFHSLSSLALARDTVLRALESTLSPIQVHVRS
jgi:hypothetical protein